MTLKEAYSYAVVFLERNGIDESDFKALCIVCSILGIKNSDYEAILKKLNLGYLLERFSDVELDTEMVAKLSGGEKQRIALARAMVGKPQVYLLDEITSSLDEQNAREMEEILLAEDAMVLYVCHKIIPELKGQYEMLTF